MTSILVACDKFAGTLTASEACSAIAEGWRRSRPDDVLVLCPMSDGGPGFLDVLQADGAGRSVAVEVPHPLAGVSARANGPNGLLAEILVRPEAVYVEAASACGLALTGRDHPTEASSYGLGVVLAHAAQAARETGSGRIVMGVGGTGTTDGGAGLLAALGATADAPLDAGGAGLRGVRELSLDAAREALGGVDLVLATDVDSPLLGPRGAAHGFAEQKGATTDQVQDLEDALADYSAALPRAGQKHPALMLGAGAGGGIGVAMLALGARREPGIEFVREAVGLDAKIAASDVVVTGEGRMDWQTLSGKVVSGVAAAAVAGARPCVALAGEVLLGRRELAAVGISAAYPVVQVPGTGTGVGAGVVSRAEALDAPAESLARLAERVAVTWSRPDAR